MAFNTPFDRGGTGYFSTYLNRGATDQTLDKLGTYREPDYGLGVPFETSDSVLEDEALTNIEDITSSPGLGVSSEGGRDDTSDIDVSLNDPLSDIDKGILTSLGLMPGVGTAASLTSLADVFGLTAVTGPATPQIGTQEFKDLTAMTPVGNTEEQDKTLATAQLTDFQSGPDTSTPGGGSSSDMEGENAAAEAASVAGAQADAQQAENEAQGVPGADTGDGGPDGNGGSSCFAAGTMIEMQGGSTAPIEGLKLGDETRGGTVMAVMQFDASGEDWYDYQGISISGDHAVREGDGWKRIEDSAKAQQEEAQDIAYDVITTDHRIFINGIEFADYEEVPKDHPVQKQVFDQLIGALNQESGQGRGQRPGGPQAGPGGQRPQIPPGALAALMRRSGGAPGPGQPGLGGGQGQPSPARLRQVAQPPRRAVPPQTGAGPFGSGIGGRGISR